MSTLRRARDFRSLIQLLRLAGLRLRAQGLALPQRLRSLRGLYYGSPYSLDYERRRSRLRNWGFNCYLQSLPPADPTPLLGPELVRALKDSAVVQDAGRTLDVGHVVIGLEARQRRRTRRWSIPTQGGSGLELATWLGDLGGAAGLLALARAQDPQVRARALLFSAEAYDLRPNLEGDVAAYLVGRATDGAGPPPVGPVHTVADALEAYLERDWSQRFLRFAPMIGAKVRGGRLAEPERFERRLNRKVFAFASSYTLAQLWRQGRPRRHDLERAGRHLEGAAAEISAIFVVWLDQGLAGLQAALPDPSPSPVGASRGLLRWMQPWCSNT